MRGNSVPEWRNCTSKDLKFVKIFDKIAADRGLSGTYKPVFLKSLLALRGYSSEESNGDFVGKEWVQVEGNELVVDLNFIATRFLKYYWDMDYVFKFKHSNDKEDVNILKRIGEIDQGNNIKPWTIKKIAKDANAELRKKVIEKSMKPEAMKSLRKRVPKLFQRKRGSMYITLDRNILGFFDRHHSTISAIINHQLVTVLERYNEFTPHIATKVGYERRHRPTIPDNTKELVRQIQKNDRCFYCERFRDKTHFDHVIPHSFAWSNDVYNIVASCQKCNCVKHARVPTDGLFGQVVDRNKELEAMTKEMAEKSITQEREFLKALNGMRGYTEDKYRALYDNYVITHKSQEKFRPELIAH